MFAVPSNATPLICRAVSNLVAVNALPLRFNPRNSLASMMLKLLMPDSAVTFPVRLPTKSANTVPALKFPWLSLATILPI